MKISKQRRILISSFITLLFSLVVFTTTTFAWFSDSLTSLDNIIQVGNLDAEMYWYNDIVGRIIRFFGMNFSDKSIESIFYFI